MSGNENSGVSRQQFAQLLANQIDFVVAAQPANSQPPVNLESGANCGFANSIVFPGAFNPLHDGHLTMAMLAARRCLRPLWFEISVENVDKPTLDFVEIANRTHQTHHPHGMILTRTPTFERKSKLFPGCIFVVGADTIARINEPRYYQNDIIAMNESIRTIAENECRFLVFARKLSKIASVGSNFRESTPLIPRLDALCEFVSADEFCMEISSTDIRDRNRPNAFTSAIRKRNT